MRLLGLLALLWMGPALADPADALPPVTRALYVDGQAAAAAGELSDARGRLRAVVRAEAGFVPAALALAEVLAALGEGEEALDLLDAHPFDEAAVELAGRIALELGDSKRAQRSFQRLQALSPESSRGVVLEAQAVARVAPLEASRLLTLALHAPDSTYPDQDLADAVSAVSSALQAAGQAEAERGLIGVLVAKHPASVVWVQERHDALQLDEEARLLAGSAAQRLDATQEAELARARKQFAQGDRGGARSTVEALLRDVPRSPEAWAALADIARSTDDVEAAEQALIRAIALDPLEAAHEEALGDLLARSYAGRADEDAVAAYRRALRNDPARQALWLRVARLEARLGRVDVAADAARRVLIANLDEPTASAARALLVDLRRERASPPVLPPAPRRPTSVPDDETWLTFHRAKVLHRRGEPDEALALLAEVRAAAPRFPGALNLEAAILLGRGDRERATELYEQSLSLDDRQPGVLAMLIELSPADVGGERLQAAADAGWADAHVLLAEERYERGRLWEVGPHLDAYFAGATSGPLHTRARALQGKVERARRAVLFGGLALLALGLGLLPARWVWRRSGLTVAELLASEPLLARDVARTCAAIRHEVIKHNITVLPAVARELDGGRSGPLAFAAERLFWEGGAFERFDAYVDDLRGHARRAGLRLALEHRDPVFSPLIAEMNVLRRLRVPMEQGGSPGLANALRSVSEALTGDVFQGLGQLIRDLEVQALDEGLISEAVAAVARELPHQPDLAVQVRIEEAVAVRAPRAAVVDILCNLLRNAHQASERAGVTGLAVVVAVEADPITFLERAVIRVADHAPHTLTTAMVRGRYIERGLGLTVDLISRHGGAIHVESEPGWSKAVVVRIPAADAGETA